MIFTPSEQERQAQAFDPDKLAAIVARIQTQGFAVVSDLVSPATCELLMQSVLEDADQVVAHSEELTPHEKVTGQGHLQLGLRRFAPFVKADLVANPLIEHVVTGVLGTGAWLGFYNGNVNRPGSVHQPLHFDRPFSWRSEDEAAQDGQTWPPPTTTLSCSVALSEITDANGATEIYPGTHLETEVAQWPLGERLSNHPDLVASHGPPSTMPIPAGGICFRDPRMWHRGVPNTSAQTRPMIALTYHGERCMHWRGRLVKRIDKAAAQRFAQDPALKFMDDGWLADGRLVFEDNTREVFTESANPHQVNRNVRFVEPGMRVNHFLDAHLVGGARLVPDGVIGPAQ